jgi:hypothetical protein
MNRSVEDLQSTASGQAQQNWLWPPSTLQQKKQAAGWVRPKAIDQHKRAGGDNSSVAHSAPKVDKVKRSPFRASEHQFLLNRFCEFIAVMALSTPSRSALIKLYAIRRFDHADQLFTLPWRHSAPCCGSFAKRAKAISAGVPLRTLAVMPSDAWWRLPRAALLDPALRNELRLALMLGCWATSRFQHSESKRFTWLWSLSACLSKCCAGRDARPGGSLDRLSQLAVAAGFSSARNASSRSKCSDRIAVIYRTCNGRE